MASFLLIGQTTLQVGVPASSLDMNVALVVPVLFSLFVFGTAAKEFTPLNYLGLAMAVVAVGLISYQEIGLLAR